MPKKTKKMKQRAAMRRVGEMAPPVDAIEGVTENLPTTVRPVLASASRVVTPATYDYSHIYSDLKRIALFAAFFFGVLIALSFVIK
jgi:hypothetical protein